MTTCSRLFSKLPPRWIRPVLGMVFGSVVAAVPSALLAAQIYKWVDADGNVQFSQNPPPAGVEADTVEPKYSKGSEQAQQALQKRLEGLEKRRDGRSKSANEQQAKAADAADKKRRCADAAKRLASYSRPRVTEVSEDGQREIIGEEQRQAELAKAREYLAEHCR